MRRHSCGASSRASVGFETPRLAPTRSWLRPRRPAELPASEAKEDHLPRRSRACGRWPRTLTTATCHCVRSRSTLSESARSSRRHRPGIGETQSRPHGQLRWPARCEEACTGTTPLTALPRQADYRKPSQRPRRAAPRGCHDRLLPRRNEGLPACCDRQLLAVEPFVEPGRSSRQRANVPRVLAANDPTFFARSPLIRW